LMIEFSNSRKPRVANLMEVLHPIVTDPSLFISLSRYWLWPFSRIRHR
jgi:hypothetical protein